MYNLQELVMEQCEANSYLLTSSQLTTSCTRTFTPHTFMLSNSNVPWNFNFSSPNVKREQYENSQGLSSYLPSVKYLSQLPPMNLYVTTGEVTEPFSHCNHTTYETNRRIDDIQYQILLFHYRGLWYSLHLSYGQMPLPNIKLMCNR